MYRGWRTSSKPSICSEVFRCSFWFVPVAFKNVWSFYKKISAYDFLDIPQKYILKIPFMHVVEATIITEYDCLIEAFLHRFSCETKIVHGLFRITLHNLL